MSFILEALKKSENKRRSKSGQHAHTIHETLPRKNPRFRLWLLVLVLLLVVNAVLLLWFFGPSKPSAVLTDTAQQEAEQRKVILPQAKPPATQERTEQALVVTPVVPEKKPQVVLAEPLVKALPVPRNDEQVYSFGQLPVSIQQQIPALQMSLHAYNRSDGTASLVQLNNRIMHEGDRVTDQLKLEKIEADGVVLRYEGYRFLLPRRRN